jgi:hypothetical protein
VTGAGSILVAAAGGLVGDSAEVPKGTQRSVLLDEPADG